MAEQGNQAIERPPVPRWQIVENVVAEIEAFRAQIPGTSITKKAKLPHDHDPGRRREVDVYVCVPTGARVFRCGIDVKHESAPLDAPDVATLIGKYRDLSKSIDRYCIVSTSGYTSPARGDAERAGVDAFTLDDLGQQPQHDGFDVSRIQQQMRVTRVRLGGFVDPSAPKVEALIRQAFAEDRFELLDNIRVEYRSGQSETLRELIIAGGSWKEQNGSPDSESLQPDTSRWAALVLEGDRISPPGMVAFSYQSRLVRRDAHRSFFRFLGMQVAAATWVDDDGCQVQATAVSLKTGDDTWAMSTSIGPAKPRQQGVDPDR